MVPQIKFKAFVLNSDFEVAGNIYENPDLVKGGDNV